MAADPRLSNAAASAAANAVVDLIDAGAGAGTLKLYGATIPTNADTATSGQTLGATLTFSDPAFGAATNGVATADAITSDTSADADVTVVWGRIADSDGNTVMDITVGTSGEDLNFNTNILATGATVAVTSLTYTQPKT